MPLLRSSLAVCGCPETLLGAHFSAPGHFHGEEVEGTDLRFGYGSFHQYYRIDGHLMAGTYKLARSLRTRCQRGADAET
jgi:hypothetical protein